MTNPVSMLESASQQLSKNLGLKNNDGKNQNKIEGKAFNEMLLDNIGKRVSESQSKSANPSKPAISSQTSLKKETMNILNLFITQLKMQDPFNVMEASDMLAQIAAIFSVEETGKVNENLEKLIEISNSNNQASYVGKNVIYTKTDGKFDEMLENGKLPFKYELSDKAKNVNIIIKTMDDRIVKTVTMSAVKGINDFVWDGVDNNGNLLTDGKYKISINANDGPGAEVKTTVKLDKKVLRSFKENGAVKFLLENNEVVTAKEIEGIFERDNKEIAANQPNNDKS